MLKTKRLMSIALTIATMATMSTSVFATNEAPQITLSEYNEGVVSNVQSPSTIVLDDDAPIGIEPRDVQYISNDKYTGREYYTEFDTDASDGNRLNIHVENTSSNIAVTIKIDMEGSDFDSKTLQPGDQHTFKYENHGVGVWENFEILAYDADESGNDISITVNARQFPT